MARKRNQERFFKEESRLPGLIDSATTSPEKGLDVALLASIKQLVRQSDANVHVAFHSLMEKLKYKHSQVRYLAVLVIDELFARSKLFRTLLVNDFEKFMLFSVGYRTDSPLPPPVNRATALKAKSMEILEKWNDNFGPHYKPLRLGYEYLKNTLRLQFPNLRQAAEQAVQQRREREARSRALTLEKYEVLKKRFPNVSADIDQTMKQLDECFFILSSSNKGHKSSGQTGEENSMDVVVDEADDDDYEDYDMNPLRQVLEKAASQPRTVCETQDNKPVFSAVRDLLKIIESQHLPTVHGWLSLLMKVDRQDSDSHGHLLRDAIDLRNKLSSMKAKCADLCVDAYQHEIVNNRICADGDVDVDDDDDIIWEEGVSPVEETSKHVTEQIPRKAGQSTPNHNSEQGLVEASKLISNVNKHSYQQVKTEESTSGKQNQQIFIKPEEPSHKGQDKVVTEKVSGKSDVNREGLLKHAPELPWGSYLDRWGSEHLVPVNPRGLLLESHWGKVDYDALLPPSKVAEMNMQASYYKPTAREIPPCLAPLRNGGFCQRRDLRVCPLHGPIIPRDSRGNPISIDSEAKSCKTKHKDIGIPSMGVTRNTVSVEAIAAAAVANIRAQDAVELQKKIDRRLQAKRNREHNAAVLREAALKNTNQGLGEILGEDLERYSSSNAVDNKQQKKRAKSSLQAMLHPKPSVKDRLAERLLNTRANDANIHAISQDEDAAYRETFLNQW